MNNRTIGNLPFSIGTSLGLESLLGIENEQNKDLTNKINNYSYLLINIKTLIRNIIGSIESENTLTLKPSKIVEILEGELIHFKTVETDNKSTKFKKIIFYASQYEGIKKIKEPFSLRVDRTELQKSYSLLVKESIELLLSKTQEDIVIIKDRLRELTIEIKKEDCLILTHFPYDLVDFEKFRSLSLLESHTGAIKDRSLWYTKYHNYKDLIALPFNLMLLQIFGDKDMFVPSQKLIRKEILDLAKKKNWHPLTTMDKIKLDISLLKNHYLKDSILQLTIR